MTPHKALLPLPWQRHLQQSFKYCKQQFSGTSINLNTTLQSNAIYKDLLTQGIINGKEEASLNSYEAVFINKDSKQLISSTFDYDRSSNQWKTNPLPNRSSDLYLIDGSWNPLQSSSSQTIADGNDLTVDYGNGIKYSISAIEKDISNKAVTEIYPVDINSPNTPGYNLFKTTPPAFPAGSKVYYSAHAPLQTTYFSFLRNTTSFKKIDEFINAYANTSKTKIDYNAVCQLQFDTVKRLVVFSSNDTPDSNCPATAQPYEIRTIGQQQILVMTAPPSSAKSLGGKEFYAINNGELLEGKVVEPVNAKNNTPATGFKVEIMYNKIAINHLLKYGGLPIDAQL
ncbi:MAG: hypothetical protein RL571_2731 [Pseudomonadota bacterium]|jgi:hypothetical protein